MPVAISWQGHKNAKCMRTWDGQPRHHPRVPQTRDWQRCLACPAAACCWPHGDGWTTAVPGGSMVKQTQCEHKIYMRSKLLWWFNLCVNKLCLKLLRTIMWIWLFFENFFYLIKEKYLHCMICRPLTFCLCNITIIYFIILFHLIFFLNIIILPCTKRCRCANSSQWSLAYFLL